MADHGGFDHNKQSLRIVEKLEKKYPEFDGLNLSWEVLEGMVKHETDYDVSDASRFDPDLRGTLEAQLANPADELAYSAHDLDDGLYSGLIRPADLTGIALWERAKDSVGWDGREFNTMWRHRLIRRLLGILIDDVLTETARRIQKAAPLSSRELQLLQENVVATTPEMAEMLSELKRFLLDRLYRHPRRLSASSRPCSKPMWPNQGNSPTGSRTRSETGISIASSATTSPA
jgi:dGTPase